MLLNMSETTQSDLQLLARYAQHRADGVAFAANGLVVIISANAVQAAPSELTLTISNAVAPTGTTFVTSASAASIAMTTLQKALVTQSIHDKKSRNEIDQLFIAQESALHDKIASVVGPEGLSQYKTFSRDLCSTITAGQFESNLTGDVAAKADKKQRPLLAMQEETKVGLVAANLPEDFQSLPMLNFRNIASEEHATIGLNLMDRTCERVAARARDSV